MFKHKLKQLLRKFLTITGLVNFIWRFLPNGIYVFNYHRIGIRESCPYDREVFSCTPSALELHIEMFKREFIIVSLGELEELIKSNKHEFNKYALITFDDGYFDNYSEAFPVLKKNEISAAFYVTTDLVGSDLIPWWDEIAFILRYSKGDSYRLPSKSIPYILNEKTIDSVINRIIYDAKRLKGISVLEVLGDVREKFPSATVQFNNDKESIFMNWTQLSEMVDSGMFVGSHTLSHQVLAQLDLTIQEKELSESKSIIESNLGHTIESVVYPVGRYHCYTSETCQLAKKAHYKFAFNNEPGRIGKLSDTHDLNRFCIGSDSLTELKLNVIFNL